MSRILEEMMSNRQKLNTKGSYIVQNGEYSVIMVQTSAEEEAERLLQERLLSEKVPDLKKSFERPEPKKKRKYTKRK